MRRRRRKEAHANHERWLVSYADFITLLFAFFVVLYASSQVDKGKMGKMAAAMEAAFHEYGVFQGSTPGPPVKVTDPPVTKKGGENNDVDKPVEGLHLKSLPSPMQSGFNRNVVEQLKKELEKALAMEIRTREVTLRVGHDGLIVSLSEMGFFDSGSAVMRSGAEPAFTRIASILAERRYAIRIEGHTDNVSIHTVLFRSNWELSTARATEMIKLLVEKYRFEPKRLSAAGYGEFHPVASNATGDGRRQNRRVDLVILAPPEAEICITAQGNRASSMKRPSTTGQGSY